MSCSFSGILRAHVSIVLAAFLMINVVRVGVRLRGVVRVLVLSRGCFWVFGSESKFRGGRFFRVRVQLPSWGSVVGRCSGA